MYIVAGNVWNLILGFMQVLKLWAGFIFKWKWLNIIFQYFYMINVTGWYFFEYIINTIHIGVLYMESFVAAALYEIILWEIIDSQWIIQRKE